MPRGTTGKPLSPFAPAGAAADAPEPLRKLSSRRLPIANSPTPHPRRDPRDPIGTDIAGKYRLRRILGHGGMGTVYEAERLSIGGAVAIKVLHPGQVRDK